MKNEFHDSALLLIGHGSTQNAGSEKPVLQHVDALRSSGEFAEVAAGFWKQEPRLIDMVKALESNRILIVPFFISEGYFCEEVIPEALGFRPVPGGEWNRVLEADDRTLVYGRPVGTHPRMTEVLLGRARSIVDEFPFPFRPAAKNTALFIAGHGTGRNAESRKSIEAQVDRIRATGEFAEVHAAFMEEEPFIKDCHAVATSRNIVMVPFFISDGLHSQEDIPVMLGEAEPIVKKRVDAGTFAWRNPTERHGKRVWYAPAIGGEAMMREVIMERAREALRLATGARS